MSYLNPEFNYGSSGSNFLGSSGYNTGSFSSSLGERPWEKFVKERKETAPPSSGSNPTYDRYGIGKSTEGKTPRAEDRVGATGFEKAMQALSKASQWTASRQQQQSDTGLQAFGGGGAQIGDGVSAFYPMIYQQAGQPSSGGSGILGGAIAGASAGSAFGPWGAGIGALAGGALGAFG